MKTIAQKSAVAGTLAVMVLGFLVVSVPEASAIVVTTTITGYNIPDAAHLTNGLEALIVPLILAEMFAMILRYFKRVGDFHVTVFFLGIALGSLVLLMTTSSGSNALAAPLAFAAVCWLVLGAWLWLGAQGEGSLATGGAE